VVVNLIGNTTTETGLRPGCVDENAYASGIKVRMELDTSEQ
jgi:hypothetical protein